MTVEPDPVGDEMDMLLFGVFMKDGNKLVFVKIEEFGAVSGNVGQGAF